MPIRNEVTQLQVAKKQHHNIKYKSGMTSLWKTLGTSCGHKKSKLKISMF